MSYLFHLFFYDPLYNGLILVLSWLPNPDIGIAVIVFTLIVKFILYPLSKKAVKTQIKMREIEPELKLLREKYKNEKEKQALEMLSLYKRNGINPFSGILLILIQLPIVLALYFIFYRGGLPEVNLGLLYPYVEEIFRTITAPINVNFLGLFDITKPQIILGLLAGVSQFIQIQILVPKIAKVDNPTFKDDMAQSINMQMRYVMPVVIFVVSLGVSGAVALYWTVGSIFTIFQELYIRNTFKKKSL